MPNGWDLLIMFIVAGLIKNIVENLLGERER
jgi:hypothetical protein